MICSCALAMAAAPRLAAVASATSRPRATAIRRPPADDLRQPAALWGLEPERRGRRSPGRGWRSPPHGGRIGSYRIALARARRRHRASGRLGSGPDQRQRAPGGRSTRRTIGYHRRPQLGRERGLDPPPEPGRDPQVSPASTAVGLTRGAGAGVPGRAAEVLPDGDPRTFARVVAERHRPGGRPGQAQQSMPGAARPMCSTTARSTARTRRRASSVAARPAGLRGGRAARTSRTTPPSYTALAHGGRPDAAPTAS